MRREVVFAPMAMRTNGGDSFEPGLIYEVLRHDGEVVNLCEIDPCHPVGTGRTICSVRFDDLVPIDPEPFGGSEWSLAVALVAAEVFARARAEGCARVLGTGRVLTLTRGSDGGSIKA